MLTHIDHVLIGVRDLDAAVRTFRDRLGFHISGGGEHPGRGTGNKLIVLDPEYIELIYVTDEQLAPPFLVEYLRKHGDGPAMYAISSDNIDADVAADQARGAPFRDPRPGQLVAPTGRRGWKSTPIEAPGGKRFPFIIQHETTGAEKRHKLAAPSEPLPQPNGVKSIASIQVAVEVLSEALETYERWYGLKAESAPQVDGDVRRVRLPLKQGAIDLVAPVDSQSPVAEWLRERGEGIMGLTLAVDNVEQSVDYIRRLGTPVQEANGIATIEPEYTQNTRLRLISAVAQ